MFRPLLVFLLLGLTVASLQAQSDDLFVIGTNTGDIDRITPAGASSHYAQVNQVLGLGGVGFAIDAHGFLYISAPYKASPSGERQDAIYRVDSTGNTTVFAQGFKQLAMLAFAQDGTLFTATDSIIYTVSPSGAVSTLTTNITGPTHLAFATNGTLFVSNVADGTILKVNPSTGSSTLFASGLDHPEGLAFDPSGNLYVAEIYQGQVKVLSATGVPTVVARIPEARSLAFDRQGNLYITSENTNAVYKMDKSGAISQFVNGLNKPLNLTFNHPIIQPVAPVAVAMPKPPLHVGLIVACSMPALILLFGFFVWYFFREKKENANSSELKT